MRIVIDLQGAQASSRHRGIGRYSISLAKAIARCAPEHEIIVALNGSFEASIEPIRATFCGLLPQENIRVWHAPGPVAHNSAANSGRRHRAELLRESALASFEPSIVLMSNLFEGLGDDVVTSICRLSRGHPTAVLLYDLIPLIHRQTYLDGPIVEQWYESKLAYLRRADLLLAISASSRQEAIDHLGRSPDTIANISTAVDDHFRIEEVSAARRQRLLDRLGLKRPFAMYTGGTDYRKNIEGLIRAFALLPEPLRRSHQLAIVCAIQAHDLIRLQTLARKHGLQRESVVFTGFVDDQDLVALYNLCKVFVFPSWHEGFGLPVLEAMACGRAVIASDTSSLPEVMGSDDALFDPHNDASIAARLRQALEDDAFRSMLEQRAPIQAARFSWDRTAMLALDAMTECVAKCARSPAITVPPSGKPRLAFVSPLPPERSGISDYSAELLPELARHYDIDVIVDQASVRNAWIESHCPIRDVDWFRAHCSLFDRILYQFGNSTFHRHMFALLDEIPGVVVLHDFFLSGVTAKMEMAGTPSFWIEALYAGHGYAAVQHRFHAGNSAATVLKYPCNSSVVRQSLGVIVHSEQARQLAHDWLGEQVAKRWAHVPLPRARAETGIQARSAARAALGLDAGTFVVGAFGRLDPVKLSHRLLDAWLASPLAADKDCMLLFVGEAAEGEYAQAIARAIASQSSGDRIRITGWTAPEVFRQYLAAADVGVQLRAGSRGETSAAALDCMNAGLATIVNTHASMAELADDAVFKLSEEFADAALGEALTVLRRDHGLRQRLGRRAAELVHTRHAPGACADLYFDAIERFYADAAGGLAELIEALGHPSAPALSEREAVQLAAAIDESIAPIGAERQLLVEVPRSDGKTDRTEARRIASDILKGWLAKPRDGWRVEPVQAASPEAGYRYARRFALRLIDCPETVLADAPVTFRTGDVFIGFDLQPEAIDARADLYRSMQMDGVGVHFIGEYGRLARCRLLIDVSGILLSDARTEIRDVAEALLRELLNHPPPGCHVQAVYAAAGERGYRYTRGFTLDLLGFASAAAQDEPVSCRAGDVYIGLAPCSRAAPGQLEELQRMRGQGVRVVFVVHDLLPLQFPACFSEEAVDRCKEWLNLALQSDGVVCLSRTAATDLEDWLAESGTAAASGFSIAWFQPGAVWPGPRRAREPAGGLATAVDASRKADAYLMVGTVEPHKAHAQVLSAFEMLWADGAASILIFAGRQGPMVESLASRIRAHGELGRRLFWFEEPDDFGLEPLYRASACLVAASLGEGSGSTLIAAARHGLPVIARDTPVFREFASDRAVYFRGEAPEDLADALLAWRELRVAAAAPRLDAMTVPTWHESAQQFFEALRLNSPARDGVAEKAAQ
jgi:glycosyltransferase involved in cell wall biosynthesis